MMYLTRRLRSFFSRLFHKRSIIIISEKRTNHVALSGNLQFMMLLAFVGCVSWASYSTGSFMAAQSVLEEKDQTIKSVTSARVDDNFSYRNPSLSPSRFSKVLATMRGPSAEAAAQFSTLNQDRLFARIAMLESKVKELKTANAEIIQTVREKTNNKIVDMEAIIRQTGLNMDTLKAEAMRIRKSAPAAAESTAEKTNGKKIEGGQGGPFISAETPVSAIDSDLSASLDKAAILSEITGRLPLGTPIKNSEPQSPFGRRVDPFTKRLAFHAGLDLAGPTGSKIYATNAGKVVSAGVMGAYGNAIDIDHGFGIVTRYGHLSSIIVHKGDMVRKDQVIGIQGSTGRSTGAHLHYEVRYYDKPINPRNFLNAGRSYDVSQIN